MTLTIDEKFALLQDMKVIDNNRKIVERLKKRMKEIEPARSDFDMDETYKELQKILGEEK